jgi:hypothetical protein
MASPPDLLSALDVAAQHLLERAGVGAKLDGETTEKDAPLVEQVKAFQAVVDWAKTRKDLVPPEKVESAFDGLRKQFNRAPAKRPRSRAPQAAAEDGNDGADVVSLFDA